MHPLKTGSPIVMMRETKEDQSTKKKWSLYFLWWWERQLERRTITILLSFLTKTFWKFENVENKSLQVLFKLSAKLPQWRLTLKKGEGKKKIKLQQVLGLPLRLRLLEPHRSGLSILSGPNMLVSSGFQATSLQVSNLSAQHNWGSLSAATRLQGDGLWHWFWFCVGGYWLDAWELRPCTFWRTSAHQPFSESFWGLPRIWKSYRNRFFLKK